MSERRELSVIPCDSRTSVASRRSKGVDPERPLNAVFLLRDCSPGSLLVSRLGSNSRRWRSYAVSVVAAGGMREEQKKGYRRCFSPPGDIARHSSRRFDIARHVDVLRRYPCASHLRAINASIEGNRAQPLEHAQGYIHAVECGRSPLARMEHRLDSHQTHPQLNGERGSRC